MFRIREGDAPEGLRDGLLPPESPEGLPRTPLLGRALAQGILVAGAVGFACMVVGGLLGGIYGAMYAAYLCPLLTLPAGMMAVAWGVFHRDVKKRG